MKVESKITKGDVYLKTIILLIALLIIGLIIAPAIFNLCEEKIWGFIKSKIEKEEKYKKMVKDITKGK